MFEQALEWIKLYWLTVIVIGAIGIFIIWKLFKRKQADEPPEQPLNYAKDFSDALFPEQGFSIMVGLNDQLKATEKQIESVRKDAKKLATDLKSLDNYYIVQKKKLIFQKKSLEIKYNTYSKQFQMVNQMIDSQKSIEGVGK